MHVSIDIAMHPIANDFVAPIHAFITALETAPGVDVESGAISTQLYGDYDTVMAALTAAMRDSFEGNTHLSLFTLRIASGDARVLLAENPRGG